MSANIQFSFVWRKIIYTTDLEVAQLATVIDKATDRHHICLRINHFIWGKKYNCSNFHVVCPGINPEKGHRIKSTNSLSWHIANCI